MTELAAIPAGVLGGEFDELCRERAALNEQHSLAWKTLETAESSLSEAKQRDHDAIAAAVREGKKRPDRKHTAAVNKAIEQAKDDLQAIKLAFDANERDTLALVAERRTDLLHTVSEQQDGKRSEALELLEQLSVVLLDFGLYDSLRRWIECPTTPASGKLQPFAAQSFRLDASRLRQLGANGRTGVPVGAVIDAIGERIESTHFLDHELLAMARAAGLEDLASVERRDTGAAALTNPHASGQPQRTVMNIADAGLTKFVLVRGRAGVQLLVAVETLQTMSAADVFKLNRQFIEQAFTDGKRMLASIDEQTTKLVARLRGDTSDDRAAERQERVEVAQETRARVAQALGIEHQPDAGSLGLEQEPVTA